MSRNRHQFSLIFRWVGLGVLVGVFLQVCGTRPVWADNMLSPGYLFNSDPTLHAIHGRLYMFVTHDQTSERFIKGTGWDNMYDYHALSTTNFHTWVDHGSIFSIHDVSWAKGNAVWDGDAGIEANGRYYAYAPFDFSIGVLVSDDPAGPYTDPLGRPLLAKDAKGVNCVKPPAPSGDQAISCGLVSPSVIWNDGVPYLVYGWGGMNIVRLKPNMTELAETPVKVDVPSDFVESPILTKINGKFYLNYSSGGMYGEGYAKPQIKYSVADSIYGPFTAGKVLQDIQINPDGQGYYKKYASSAHQDIAYYKGQWYFAYHKDSKDGWHRHVCITKLDVRPDGTLGVIDPNTDEGVVEGPIDFILDAFAPYKREAEEFHERNGADEEPGIRQDFHFKMKNGGFLRFNRMDFGSGAGGYRIEVSSENSELRNAKAEFRLDAVDGRIIGEASIAFTGGRTNYVVRSGPVQRVKGIHDLFIIASGEGGDAAGHLFNINWFTFTKNVPVKK